MGKRRVSLRVEEGDPTRRHVFEEQGIVTLRKRSVWRHCSGVRCKEPKGDRVELADSGGPAWTRWMESRVCRGEARREKCFARSGRGLGVVLGRCRPGAQIRDSQKRKGVQDQRIPVILRHDATVARAVEWQKMRLALAMRLMDHSLATGRNLQSIRAWGGKSKRQVEREAGGAAAWGNQVPNLSE